jgi:hypothetical protein
MGDLGGFAVFHGKAGVAPETTVPLKELGGKWAMGRNPV